MRKKKRRLKKGVKVGIFIFFIIIILTGGFVMKNKLFNSILTYRNLEVEINSKVNLYDLIEKDDNIIFITDNYEIDTTKLGKKELKITVSKDDTEYNLSFEINVIDTEKPNIIGKDVITINVGSEIDLLKDVSITDNSNEKLEVAIRGEYDLNKAGEYDLKYYTSDSSGNVGMKNFTLKVIDLKEAPNDYEEYKELKDGEYLTSTGYTLTIKDGVSYVDGYVIVNKTYALPSNYKTIDPYSGTVTSDSCITCIDKVTMEAFKKMEVDARSIGLNIYISSGYRSYDRQRTLFNNYSARDGKEAADKYSARAGHSEHQTGYCFDLNTIDDSFANTDEGIWINNNAYLYGFIIRYPKGKEDVTGYQYESWHLRYVGRDLAEKLYNSGDWITMEEYFGLTSSYS